MSHLTASALLLCMILAACIHSSFSKTSSKQAQKKKDPYDNPGNTPFFLQDPHDNTCLGPNGFTVCDERALWVLTRRADRKNTYSLVSLLQPSPYGMCLERKKWFFGLLSGDDVGMGLCSKPGAKNWAFEFIDKTHVKLSSGGMCLVRGKKKYKNSISVQPCKKGEFLPLVYHSTTVHEAGFYLKAADGACFDGERFRSCDGSSKNLWGVGIKYIWGKANRYFFTFSEKGQTCAVAKGSSVGRDSCQHGGAMKWGLADGRLSINNEKMCVNRLPDNTAALSRCGEGSEHIVMDIPTVYTSEDLAHMLQNQDKLSPEEKAALAQLVKQHSLTG
jgi:hypothetical protein